MSIETKFAPNDLAWYKYDNKWYLCAILDVHFNAYINDITGKLITNIYYKVYFKEVTGIPEYRKGESYAYLYED